MVTVVAEPVTVITPLRSCGLLLAVADHVNVPVPDNCPEGTLSHVESVLTRQAQPVGTVTATVPLFALALNAIEPGKTDNEEQSCANKGAAAASSSRSFIVRMLTRTGRLSE
jgi:hypothetical protein